MSRCLPMRPYFWALSMIAQHSCAKLAKFSPPRQNLRYRFSAKTNGERHGERLSDAGRSVRRSGRDQGRSVLGPSMESIK